MKGRLGDTFPASFSTLDMRVTKRWPNNVNISTLVQELGHLCFHTDNTPDYWNRVALVSKSLLRGHLFTFEIIGRIQFESAPIEPAISPIPSPRNLLLSVTAGVDLAFMVMVAISYDAYLDGYLKPNNRLISFD